MLINNSCPRCGGHMHIECDEYGFYKACLICGYTRDLENSAFIKWDGTKPTKELPLQEYSEITPLPLESEESALSHITNPG